VKYISLNALTRIRSPFSTFAPVKSFIHVSIRTDDKVYNCKTAAVSFCPPFACLQCKGWAIAMTLSVCLSVCPHKTRNCEETERRTKKVLEIKVVGYDDSYSGVPSVVTSDDI
jgi:hypothetical protein